MSPDVESLEDFRQRARTWIRANLDPDTTGYFEALRSSGDDEEEVRRVQHDRDLQRAMFDAGLAGIIVPVEYGGQGLTPAHQRVLDEEMNGYELPRRVQVPTMSPCMAILLEFGTEEQKQRHVPPILRGEELWMQFLSEPSGGSDVAGALTTAVRDGDEWVLNGSKIWTTGAWWSDWGLCLARTDWDVPKHRGLTVFMLPIHQEGIEVHRIEMLNGNREFCQEFITDVRVPDSDRIGEVHDGWTVGTRWMFHERMHLHSPYVIRPSGTTHEGGTNPEVSGAFDVARASGRLEDARVRDLLGELVVLQTVGAELGTRIGESMRVGGRDLSAIGRLFHADASVHARTVNFELAGAAGGAWADEDGDLGQRGVDFLMRQAGSIGGGTTEMARNVISERVLGMPRERSLDRDIAFRDVPRGPSSRGRGAP
ncbi:MAG TPA: acyl-CoA dehydrogenase family protein [Acidimicrobiales bacterium]|nr:acyl-CoA dehydrogenase family protein [Acidimicrobiales bacterium]